MKHLLSRVHESLLYSVVLIILVLAAAGLVVYEYLAAGTLSQEFLRFSYKTDLVISFVFLFDYVLGLWLAEQRRSYVLSLSGFLNLISSLPFPEGALQSLRILKIARALRGIRLVRVAAQGESLYLRRNGHDENPTSGGNAESGA